EEFAHSRNPERAAVRTLATTGSALLGSALTTALGLGVLVASPLAASQQFGITAAITIAYSLVVAILVVPPAMTVWGAYQNMRLRSMVDRWADELDTAIEAVHQRHEQEQGTP
ncbi:MAG: MMPL family transporter, partial [Chloroflexi bacterium]|nr:MMPL family transporter [Chloroflexota bacterium]